MRRLLLAASIVTLALSPGYGRAEEPAPAPAPPLSQVPANPQRPTRSQNAQVTPTGYVQMETGIDYANDSASVGVTLRFGLTWNVDFSLETTPYLRVDTLGGTESGFGDTVLAMKLRFFESRDGGAAIIGFGKIPTADEQKGLGTGDVDAGFRFVASRTWGKNTFDFNLGADFASVREAEANDARWTGILTWSQRVGERFHYFGEIFLQFLPAADVENITTDWGVSYYFNPSFALDSAFYLGLSDDAPDYTVTIGLTKIIGRMFPAPPRRSR